MSALKPGQFVQGYLIEDCIGYGGFSITYRAIQTGGERHTVAIKEYFPRDCAERDPDGISVRPKPKKEADFEYGLKRFIAEAKVVQSFRHPSIIHVENILQSQGTMYMIMEYADGQTLYHWVKSGGAITDQSLIKLFVPILHALRQIHAKGFLHRDIKPSNIYLRHDGSPVLLDFGSARTKTADINQTLTAVVTDGYTPPEQYNKRGKQGPWSDLYAVGATLYFCVSEGTTPVNSVSRATAFAQKQDDPLLPAKVLHRGRCTPAFLQTIDWMMTLVITDRPQSANEVIARWQRYKSAMAVNKKKKNQRLLLAGTALSVLVGGGIAGSFWLNNSRETQVVRDAPAKIQESVDKGIVTAAPPTKPEPQLPVDEPPPTPAPVRDTPITGNYVRDLQPLDEQPQPLPPIAPAEAMDENVGLDERAASGDKLAQYELASRLLQQGGRDNDGSGLAWLKKAAAQNHAPAQFLLGRCYAQGRGTPRDHAQAVRWYHAAAKAGHTEAQYHYARMLQHGLGASQDLPEAHYWYKKAAEKKDIHAQLELARMLEAGAGAQVDLQGAIHWYFEAARRGNAEAQTNLARMFETGAGVGVDMESAGQWYQKAAAAGYAPAQYQLGLLFETGNGVNRDLAQAKIWYGKAAAQKHVKAVQKLRGLGTVP